MGAETGTPCIVSLEEVQAAERERKELAAEIERQRARADAAERDAKAWQMYHETCIGPAKAKALEIERDSARATIATLREEVDAFKAAAMLDVGGDPGGVTPAHFEKEIRSLREEVERLRGAICTVADEANGPHPVQSAEDAMAEIECAIFEYRQRLEAARTRTDRWRGRAKKLIACAREAQFEVTAKTIRYAALMEVLTPLELENLNRRIKERSEARRARITALRAALSPPQANPQEPEGSSK